MTGTEQVEVEATIQRPMEPTRASSVGEVKTAGGEFMEKSFNPYLKVSKGEHEDYHDAGVRHVHMGGSALLVMLR